MKETVSRIMPALRPYALLPFVYLYVLQMAYKMRDYVMDDAYIGFRYVANLISGNGLVFNPPDRVEGMTNAGWLLLIAPFARVAEIPTVAKTLGVLLVLVSVTLSYAIALKVSKDKCNYLLALPVPFLIATHFDYIFFSLVGMETALLSAILCAVVYLALVDRCRILVALLCGFAFAVRPEAVLIYPVALLLSLGRDRDKWKQHLVPAATFAAVCIGLTLARYAYYAAILPNTFYAKPALAEGPVGSLYTTLAATNLNIPAPFGGVLALAVLAYGALSLRTRNWQLGAYGAAVVLVAVAFCTYARADWSAMGRYFAPYVPVAFVLLWIGLVESHRRLLGEGRMNPLLTVYAALIMLMGTTSGAGWLSDESVKSYPGYVLTGKNLVAPSIWVRDNLPADSIIATRRIGALAYYSEMRIFDYKFGLIDKEVARLVRANGEAFDDPHNPALAELWGSVSPDYILEDLWRIEEIADAAGGTLSAFEIHGITYRLKRKFPIGQEVDWALCEKIHPRLKQ